MSLGRTSYYETLYYLIQKSERDGAMDCKSFSNAFSQSKNLIKTRKTKFSKLINSLKRLFE